MNKFNHYLPIVTNGITTILLSFSMLGNNLFNRKTLLILLIIGVYNCRHKLTTLIKNSLKLWPLLLLLGWCLLSQYWSRWPEETIMAVFIQILMLIMCFSLVESLGTEKTKKILINAAILAIIINLVYILTHPNSAFSSRGLTSFYYSKNNIGLVMAISSILLFFSYKTKFKWLLFCLSFSLLLATNSKTSLVLFILCLLLTWLFTLSSTTEDPKSQLFFYMFCQTIGLTLVIYLSTHQEELLNYVYYQLDEDLLTGRGKLWSTMLLHAEEQLNYGLGFEAVWVGSENSEIYYTELVESAPLWVEQIVSSDGGYVDILVSTGFVGLGLTLFLFIHCFLLALRHPSRSELAPFVAIFLFTIGHNVTESTLLISTNVLWLMFLLAIFSMTNPPSSVETSVFSTKLVFSEGENLG